LLLVLTLLAEFPWSRPSSEPRSRPTDETSAKQIDVPGELGGKPRAPVATTELAQKRVLVIVPLAQESEERLRDASVVSAESSSVTIDYAASSNLARVAADGELVVEALPGQELLVRADGRLPRVLRLPDRFESGTRLEVRLLRAYTLDVSVLSESGIPVSGARVEVSPHQFGSFVGGHDVGEGNPRSNYPVWSANSDANGLARVRGVPFGHLYISAWHPDHVPATLNDDHRHVLCDADTTVSILLKPLYGVVFEGPPLDEITASYWNVEGDLEITGGHVIAAAARGKQALADRFPDCLVYAHRPEDVAQEVIVNCWVQTTSGDVFRSRWPLQPVTDWVDPVYMEPVPGVVLRRLRTYVETPSKRRIPIAMGFRHVTFGFGVPARSDCDYELPTGSYRMSVARAHRSLRESLRGREVLITEVSHPDGELVIPVDAEVVRITVRAEFEGRAGLGVTHVNVKPSLGRGFMASNWRADAEVLELYLAPGATRLEFRSHGYEDVDLDTAVEDSAELVVKLREG
jgi:hypothetical protein